MPLNNNYLLKRIKQNKYKNNQNKRKSGFKNHNFINKLKHNKNN